MLPTHQNLVAAKSVAEAIAALADRGEQAAPIAGATWIMRAPIRQEPFDRTYVAIGTIGELRRVEISGSEVAIGACVTHAQLVAALASVPECNALTAAAAGAANPAIRQVATIGGNLCTAAFAASDLVPALLCLDADIELATTAGIERMPIARFLAKRGSLAAALLTRIIIPRNPARSVHVRLPLRKAGDYPVAILSLAAAIRPDGSDRSHARRGRLGRNGRAPLGNARGGTAGPPRSTRKRHSSSPMRMPRCFEGRDGVEAPGWYRVKVLPSLVRRAAQALLERS